MEDSQSIFDILHFSIGRTHFCMPILYIEKVVPFMLPETVPDAPDSLIGLINIGGNSVPLVDPAIRFNLGRKKPYSIEHSILLCSDGVKHAALIVDDIIGLVSIDLKEHPLQKQVLSESPCNFLKGSFILNDEILLLIDIKKMLDNLLPEASQKRISVYE